MKHTTIPIVLACLLAVGCQSVTNNVTVRATGPVNVTNTTERPVTVNPNTTATIPLR